MKPKKIKACVKYLVVNGDIYVDDKQYYKTPRPWKPDLEKSREITGIRKNELLQMDEFTMTTNCYMEYISKVLDDQHTKICGKCANCLNHPLVQLKVTEASILEAQQFIREDFNVIEPRKKWPTGVRVNGKNNIDASLLCETGRVLSNYGDAGWGKLVSVGKYKEGVFDDQLVEASYILLKGFIVENKIIWVTNIPSLRRPQLVKSFTERLANRLGLKYIEVIEKTQDVRCQKELNTSYLQYQNAYDSFGIHQPISKGNVLLIDDMVDSRWTFTACGYKLRINGSGKVFPFALANSAGRDGDE
jgi:ATP-dependent DNA helicase RecQ